MLSTPTEEETLKERSGRRAGRRGRQRRRNDPAPKSVEVSRGVDQDKFTTLVKPSGGAIEI